jgi:endonuclease III
MPLYGGGVVADKKRIGPKDLNIDLSDGKPQELYRWFLACLLFGRPIQQEIAAEAYRYLIEAGLTAPEKFAEIKREPLRKLLDEANYARYDYATADELHDVMARVVDEYGSVARMVKDADSTDEVRRRLMDFKGVGAKTAGIYLEELPAKFNGNN